VTVGDAALRQELAAGVSTGQGGMLVSGAVIYVDTIADLQALPTSELVDGQAASVQGSILRWDTSSALWQPGDRIGIEAFGAVGDGAFDNASVFSELSTYLRNYEGTITAGPGVFYTNATFVIPRHASFHGVSSIISAEGSGGSFDRAVVLKEGAAPSRIADLAASPVKGSTTLSFSVAHNLNINDTILLYNPVNGSYTTFRDSYREGEFVKVKSIESATQIKVERPLYTSHDHLMTEVYHCADMASGRLEGFKAIAPGPGVNGAINGWRIKFAEGVVLHGTASDGSDNASAVMQLCYRCNGSKMHERQWGRNPGFGTQYGLSIANCQDLMISGDFVGDRHGIATGGFDELSIVNRGIVVHDFTASCNDPLVAAADWHGNTEHSKYINGKCYGGGLNIAGDFNVIESVEVHGGPSCIPILGREIAGLSHRVSNFWFYSDRNDLSRGMIDIGGNSSAFNSSTIRGGTLVIESVYGIAPNHERSAVLVRNRGFTGDPWSLFVDGFRYECPSIGTFSVISVEGVSGGAAERISVTNIEQISPLSQSYPLRVAGTDAGAKVRMDAVSGVATLSLISTNNTSTSAVLDMPVRFPKVPHGVAALVGDVTTAGSKRIAAILFSISANTIRTQVYQVDATDGFGEDTSRDVHWQATLCEF
jgi:hypothetical protein